MKLWKQASLKLQDNQDVPDKLEVDFIWLYRQISWLKRPIACNSKSLSQRFSAESNPSSWDELFRLKAQSFLFNEIQFEFLSLTKDSVQRFTKGFKGSYKPFRKVFCKWDTILVVLQSSDF